MPSRSTCQSLKKGTFSEGNARDAVKAAELGGADVEFGPRGRIDRIEEDQGHCQRDDAEVDVADAAIEHEIAEQRREGCGHKDGRMSGAVLSPILIIGDRVSIGAKSEKRGLAETENAAKAPDEGEATEPAPP